MIKKDRSKIFASDALDDLLKEQRNQSRQNWLLSYLDVFVLVVMLMVTLVSITEQSQPKKSTKRKPKSATQIITAPQPVSTPSSTELQSAPVATNLTPTLKPIPTKSAAAIEQEALEKQAQAELSEEIKRLGLEQTVKMTVNKGFAQFDIQNNVLFQSSSTELSPEGEEVLLSLIPLLQDSNGPILIEGHSDNRPVKSGQFRSNWELSSARANSVLHFLNGQDIDANRMRAISFGDTKPIADNKTKDGRDKNRRVNIVVQIENKTDTGE